MTYWIKRKLTDWFGIGTYAISREEADRINAETLKQFKAPSINTLEKIKHFYVETNLDLD